jgi:hypothetical protein
MRVQEVPLVVEWWKHAEHDASEANDDWALEVFGQFGLLDVCVPVATFRLPQTSSCD